MRCRLVRPSVGYLNSLECFKQAFINNSKEMHGTSGLYKYSDLNVWLHKVNNQYNESIKSEKPRQLEYLYVTDDNTVIGMINFRDLYTDFLKECGGNVGYCIHPMYRKLGLGSNMLTELLSNIDYDNVLITCLCNNYASRNTIISCGGVFDRISLDPLTNKNLFRYYIYNIDKLEQRIIQSRVSFIFNTMDGVEHSFTKDKKYAYYKIDGNKYLFVDDSNKYVFITQFELNKSFK